MSRAGISQLSSRAKILNECAQRERKLSARKLPRRVGRSARCSPCKNKLNDLSRNPREALDVQYARSPSLSLPRLFLCLRTPCRLLSSSLYARATGRREQSRVILNSLQKLRSPEFPFEMSLSRSPPLYRRARERTLYIYARFINFHMPRASPLVREARARRHTPSEREKAQVRAERQGERSGLAHRGPRISLLSALSFYRSLPPFLLFPPPSLTRWLALVYGRRKSVIDKVYQVARTTRHRALRRAAAARALSRPSEETEEREN